VLAGTHNDSRNRTGGQAAGTEEWPGCRLAGRARL